MASFNRPDQPVALTDAVQLGKQGAPVGNQNAAKDRSENKPDAVRFEYGNSAAYTLARLDRERSDVLDAYERGESKSV